MEKRLDGYFFKDTRIQVSLLLSYIKDGSTIEEFLEDFPSVSTEDVDRVLAELISHLKFNQFKNLK